ncbi:hypothetical protein STANM309S_04577 [Streptomyces tanashiensis]
MGWKVVRAPNWSPPKTAAAISAGADRKTPMRRLRPKNFHSWVRRKRR